MAKSKIILLDSDVISHFMSTAKIDLLPKILSPHRLFIVADVYRESIHHPLFEDCNKFMHDAIVINDGRFPVAKYEDYSPTRNLDEFCLPLE